VNDVNKAKEQLREKVCRHYPWLASELFELEGYLGVGPGHRDYEGEGFPPPTPDAPDKLQRFMDVLRRVPICHIPEKLCNAAEGEQPHKYAELLLSGMFSRAHISKRLRENHKMVLLFPSAVRRLALVLNAQEGRRTEEIFQLHSEISEKHSTYVLGGARIYLDQWRYNQNYYLAASGLVWLLCNPITKQHVEGMLKRFCPHMLKRRIKTTEPETMPVFAEPQKLVAVHATCRA